MIGDGARLFEDGTTSPSCDSWVPPVPLGIVLMRYSAKDEANAMKISIARMIANLAARGRGLGTGSRGGVGGFRPQRLWMPTASRGRVTGTPIIGSSSRARGLLATLWSRRHSRPRWLRCPIRGAGL